MPYILKIIETITNECKKMGYTIPYLTEKLDMSETSLKRIFSKDPGKYNLRYSTIEPLVNFLFEDTDSLGNVDDDAKTEIIDLLSKQGGAMEQEYKQKITDMEADHTKKLAEAEAASHRVYEERLSEYKSQLDFLKVQLANKSAEHDKILTYTRKRFEARIDYLEAQLYEKDKKIEKYTSELDNDRKRTHFLSILCAVMGILLVNYLKIDANNLDIGFIQDTHISPLTIILVASIAVAGYFIITAIINFIKLLKTKKEDDKPAD